MLDKNWLTEHATVALTKECNSWIQNRLPTKLKDPGNFTIKITVRQSIGSQGLCDL